MRHRATLGLAAVLCACAVSASPALAATPVFKASEVGKEFSEITPGKSKGKGIEGQLFSFGGFKITCEKASATGKITAAVSKTLFTVVKYSACTTAAQFGQFTGKIRTTISTPISLEYHANGFVEAGGTSESEVKLVNPGSVELTISGIKCRITVPPQTIPVHANAQPESTIFSAAVYENQKVPQPERLKRFPSGEQMKLLITNEFKGMTYEVTEGQCGESGQFEAVKHSGRYEGVLLEELPSGNLEIGTSEEI